MKRFWDKVLIARVDECWLWQAGRFWDGYGSFYKDHKLKRAHRVSWELANGEIPKGLIVCHSCDVPLCVNPAHLWLGTHKLNSKDRDTKGRRTHNIKLTKEQVLEIYLDENGNPNVKPNSGKAKRPSRPKRPERP